MSTRRLLKDQAYGADTYTLLDDDEPLPARGDVLLALERYLLERPAAAARRGRLGVWLRPQDDALSLAGALDGVSLIVVDFPRYNDGRGYSHARHLREHLGFTGELRATGDVGADQLFALRRCGFDAFALRDDVDPQLAIKALDRYSTAMQPSAWSPDARARTAAE
jgi:uncharacterized protein (DUF934 family)